MGADAACHSGMRSIVNNGCLTNLANHDLSRVGLVDGESLVLVGCDCRGALLVLLEH